MKIISTAAITILALTSISAGATSNKFSAKTQAVTKVPTYQNSRYSLGQQGQVDFQPYLPSSENYTPQTSSVKQSDTRTKLFYARISEQS